MDPSKPSVRDNEGKKANFYNIQLEGPLFESWRIKLDAAGVKFLRTNDYNL
jgi:hypothetical protein